MAKGSGNTRGTNITMENLQVQMNHPKKQDDTWEDNSKTIGLLKQLTSIKSDKLAKDYLDAVEKFTGTYSYDIRKVQSGDYTDLDYDKKEVKKAAKNLEEFIKLSPKWEGGITYRGITLSEKELNDFISDAKSTKGVSMRGASSWSTNRDVADNAMMYFDYDSVDKFGNPKNCRVILRCKKQKYATSIDYLSVNYGQDEVVASSRARYKLVQVRNSGDNYFIDIEAK